MLGSEIVARSEVRSLVAVMIESWVKVQRLLKQMPTTIAADDSFQYMRREPSVQVSRGRELQPRLT